MTPPTVRRLVTFRPGTWPRLIALVGRGHASGLVAQLVEAWLNGQPPPPRPGLGATFQPPPPVEAVEQIRPIRRPATVPGAPPR